ncbi:MAG: hypothetical protein ABR564_05260 [Candidatus Dormibacteria bacterium]
MPDRSFRKGTGAPRRRPAGSVTGVLLRFVSCGLLSLTAGAGWRLTRGPQRIGVAGALAGILILLAGFIAGGLLWYVLDLRTRERHPERVPDEQLVFSFVVFAVVPFAVLIPVGAVWLLAVIIGLG